jgi:hypothetical protein
MIDKFLYNFFSSIDTFFSVIEKYSIKMTESLWQIRVKLLNRKRKRK